MRRVLAALVAARACGVTYAADVGFTGSVTADCTVVASGGSLAVNAARDTLSSKEAGGAAGSAEVNAAGGPFNVTIGGPAAFDYAPSGGDSEVTFQTEYSASGATTASGSADASPTFALNSGATVIAIDTTASRDSDAFPTGDYGLTATVTCSPQ